MKSYLKIICAIAISFSGFNFAHAQVEAVKSDDVLSWKQNLFVATGRDISEGPDIVEVAKVKVDNVTGEHTYFFQKGIMRRSKTFALLQRGDYVLKADQSFDYFPKNFTVGEKWKHNTYANSNRCGRIKYDYEATSTQGPEVVIKLKGVPTTLKTLMVVHEGVWWSGACGGSGRAYLKYIYSPELNELIHIEDRYFYNGFLTSGGKFVLESVN